MTQDELFTAIYLVCGALPSKPDCIKDTAKLALRCRRQLPNGQWQYWLVDDQFGYGSDVDSRVVHDPAYMEYFDKACRVAMLSYAEFSQFITWAEAHEQRR